MRLKPRGRDARHFSTSLAFARARCAEPIRVRQDTAGSGARRVVYRAPNGTCYVRTVCVCTSPTLYRLGGVRPGVVPMRYAAQAAIASRIHLTCGTALGLLVR